MKNINLEIQEGQQNLSRINTKRSIPRHVKQTVESQRKMGKQKKQRTKNKTQKTKKRKRRMKVTK